LLAQLQDAGGGEALGMRGDAKAMARRQRLAGRQIGVAEGALEHDPAAMGDRDDAARLLGHAHLERQPFRDVFQRAAQPSRFGLGPHVPVLHGRHGLARPFASRKRDRLRFAKKLSTTPQPNDDAAAK
jgi:hypothetical protein